MVCVIPPDIASACLPTSGPNLHGPGRLICGGFQDGGSTGGALEEGGALGLEGFEV